MSSGSAIRPSMSSAGRAISPRCHNASIRGVRTMPGTTAFTRTLGHHSSAIVRTSESRPAFAAP